MRNPKLSIYAAKQGMKACNNNMRNPKLKDVRRGYACYYCYMPSSPVLLHIYLVSGYAYYYCCMPSIPVLLHIIYCSFLYFLALSSLHPSIFFNGNVFYTCFTNFSLYTCLQMQYSLCECEPHPFCCSWSYETHVSNNEEMAFNYTEVLYSRFLLFSFEKDPRKILMAKDHAQERKKLFYDKTKVCMLSICGRPFDKVEEDGEIGSLAIFCMSL